MLSLISGAITYLSSTPTYNFVVVGLDNAGKTTLVSQLRTIYKNDKFSKQKLLTQVPTIGLNFTDIKSADYTLVFWDLGGQTELRKIWHNYYQKAHGIIFVVDCSDQERIEEVRTTLQNVLSNRALSGKPLLVLANKQDLHRSLGAVDLMDHLQLDQSLAKATAAGCERRAMHIQSCSALYKNGIEDGLGWLLSRVAGTQQQFDHHRASPPKKLRDEGSGRLLGTANTEKCSPVPGKRRQSRSPSPRRNSPHSGLHRRQSPTRRQPSSGRDSPTLRKRISPTNGEVIEFRKASM